MKKLICIIPFLFAGCASESDESLAQKNKKSEVVTQQLPNNCTLYITNIHHRVPNTALSTITTVFFSDCPTASTTTIYTGKSNTPVPTIVPKQLSQEELNEIAIAKVKEKLTPEELNLLTKTVK